LEETEFNIVSGPLQQTTWQDPDFLVWDTDYKIKVFISDAPYAFESQVVRPLGYQGESTE
jgi:hypothetical protein